MRSRLLLAIVLFAGSVATVATVAAPASVAVASNPGVRYIDRIFTATTETADIEYAVAPSLTTGQPERLLLDSYTSVGDTEADRPAIVFIHGGGFRSGKKEDLGRMAEQWAERGYATFSIGYRLDPDNRCQDIQQGKVAPGDYAVEYARCAAAIYAAQHDGQAAIRWIRANAASLGVDPTKVAVIGGSAGAVTATHIAHRSDDPGTVGTHLDQDSGVQAAIAMSGCNYDPASIGAGDAPMFFLHADGDMPVPFPCVESTVRLAQAAGLTVETMFYYGETTHARSLYIKYQPEVDPRWAAFLFANLGLGPIVAAGGQTVIHGLPGRSAVVSIISVGNTVPGYVQVLQCGTTPGGSSNLNTDGAGQIRAGLAIVRFDAAGEACLFNSSPTNLVADLQGYFAEGSIDDVADQRLLDTRAGGAARLANGTTTQLTGRPNSTAVVSLVATDTSAGGYLQVLPCGTPAGGSSNLNADRAGQNIANLAFVRFDATGHVCVFNQTAIHLVVDLQAYLADGAFDDATDVRALDTRSGARPANGSRTPVGGRASSTAVVSLIATETTLPGYVQALPCAGTAGGSSNLNIDRADQTVANLAFVAFDAAGRFCLFTSAASHLVADVQGYLTAGAFDDIADQRLLDTRIG